MDYQSAVYLWNGKMIFFRNSIFTEEHTHLAMQICLGLEDTIKIYDQEKNMYEGRIIIIDSNTPHMIKAENKNNLFIFIEPTLLISRQIKEKYSLNKNIHIMDDITYQNYLDKFYTIYGKSISYDVIYKILEEFLESISQSNKRNLQIDFRIRKILTLLNQDHSQYPINSLSEVAELSESRLMHLFKTQIGVPIRKYILWRRLLKSIEYVSLGKSLSDSAMESGFSDVAHYNRTFKKMFGITPTEVLRNFGNQASVSIHICEK
jgi:AraC-like DNA-binding protein